MIYFLKHKIKYIAVFVYFFTTKNTIFYIIILYWEKHFPFVGLSTLTFAYMWGM